MITDILRDGFSEKGDAHSAEDWAQLGRAGWHDWHHYVLVIYKDHDGELHPDEIEGRGRSDDEAVAWFRKHVRLDEVDYLIFRKETTYTQLAGNVESA
jgi:hypothetical protein